MWAKIITINRTKDLNYFSLCALNLFNTQVSQFELNYWNRWTFPQHSNLLRCTCLCYFLFYFMYFIKIFVYILFYKIFYYLYTNCIYAFCFLFPHLLFSIPSPKLITFHFPFGRDKRRHRLMRCALRKAFWLILESHKEHFQRKKQKNTTRNDYIFYIIPAKFQECWGFLKIFMKWILKDFQITGATILFIYILHLCNFYPKGLTVHSGYTFFYQYACSLGIEPTTICAANAMLYHWAKGTHYFTVFYKQQYFIHNKT